MSGDHLDLIRRLRDVGEASIAHRYDGECPEGDPDVGDTQRDPDCEACQILMEADALLGDDARS